MLRNRNLPISNEDEVSKFGIIMTDNEYQKIKKKLEHLRQRAPYKCSINLNFEKADSAYVGSLCIRSFSQTFQSEQVGLTPYQTYLLIEEEIDLQLLNWKRKRFNSSIKDYFQDKEFNSQIA